MALLQKNDRRYTQKHDQHDETDHASGGVIKKNFDKLKRVKVHDTSPIKNSCLFASAPAHKMRDSTSPAKLADKKMKLIGLLGNTDIVGAGFYQ